MSLGNLSGGPGAFVPVIISAAWDRATSMTEQAKERVDEAVALATPAPTTPAPDRVIAPVLPATPTLTALDMPSATALFDSRSEDVVNMLAGLFRDFLSTHFPVDDYVTEAQDWVSRALTVGGSGVNAAVEAQLWNRARDRALKDANRAVEQLESEWAARRFPMPPGALRHGTLMIQRGAQDAIAEAARTQASEAFMREVENARLAVERAVSLRSLALQSAGEYIRTLAMGPTVATQAASAIIDAQSRFSTTTTDLYRAQIAAAEIPVRVATTNAELKVRANEANLRTAMDALNARVNAVMASAQMVGTQAAAALNAIHTQASVAGTDQTVTSIEG